MNTLETVKEIRALALQIRSITEMTGTFNHERLGTPEGRQIAIRKASTKIAELAREFDPGHPDPLNPPNNINFVDRIYISRNMKGKND